MRSLDQILTNLLIIVKFAHHDFFEIMGIGCHHPVLSQDYQPNVVPRFTVGMTHLVLEDQAWRQILAPVNHVQRVYTGL